MHAALSLKLRHDGNPWLGSLGHREPSTCASLSPSRLVTEPLGTDTSRARGSQAAALF